MTSRTLLVSFVLLAVAAPASAAPKHAVAPVAKVRALPDSAALVSLLSGVTNGACPLAGVATGGQPAASHVAALAKAGFTTVLDLRTPAEDHGFDEAAAMRAAKLDYVSIPVTAATLDDSVFTRVRAELQKHDGRGVFVHCASGNRVGAAMIPWYVLDRGWDIERAVATAKAGGLHSAEMEAKARDYVARQRAAR